MSQKEISSTTKPVKDPIQPIARKNALSAITEALRNYRLKTLAQKSQDKR
jgi:hypothetical protein